MRLLRLAAVAVAVVLGAALLATLLRSRPAALPGETVSIEPAQAPESHAEERLVVKGERTPGAQVEIRVNGKLQAAGNPEGSTYYATVRLDPGLNRIEATAIKNGARSSRTFDVFRSSITFTDMGTHWAKPHAEILATMGIVSGMGNGAFAPEERVTRAQFAKMVVLALNLPVDQSATLSFRDARTVPDWGRPYVAAAVQAGLIKGYDDNTFRADQPITRAQIAAVVARGLWLKGNQPGGQARPFADRNAIPTWASADVEKAAQAGIITGYEDGTFRAERTASRGEAAAMIRRLWAATQ